MSYDTKMEAECHWCQRWVCLGVDYEVRLGNEMHPECAKEWDAEFGPFCTCGHEWDNHTAATTHYGCAICICSKYDHAHGEDPKDHDPTDAELRQMYGPQ